MKKPNYPVANSRKTKFEDSDEHELSPSEDVRNPKIPHNFFYFLFSICFLFKLC